MRGVKKEQQRKNLSWTHKFICLSNTYSNKVPSKGFKLALEEADLGEKNITIPINCSPQELKNILLAAYPKLEGGGGFELLRSKPQSRDLMLIGPRVASTPRLLKHRVGNAHVYVRPIQRDLNMEEATQSEEVSKCVSSILDGGCRSLYPGTSSL